MAKTKEIIEQNPIEIDPIVGFMVSYEGLRYLRSKAITVGEVESITLAYSGLKLYPTEQA